MAECFFKVCPENSIMLKTRELTYFFLNVKTRNKVIPLLTLWPISHSDLINSDYDYFQREGADNEVGLYI